MAQSANQEASSPVGSVHTGEDAEVIMPPTPQAVVTWGHRVVMKQTALIAELELQRGRNPCRTGLALLCSTCCDGRGRRLGGRRVTVARPCCPQWCREAFLLFHDAIAVLQQQCCDLAEGAAKPLEGWLELWERVGRPDVGRHQGCSMEGSW